MNQFYDLIRFFYRPNHFPLPAFPMLTLLNCYVEINFNSDIFQQILSVCVFCEHTLSSVHTYILNSIAQCMFVNLNILKINCTQLNFVFFYNLIKLSFNFLSHLYRGHVCMYVCIFVIGMVLLYLQYKKIIRYLVTFPFFCDLKNSILSASHMYYKIKLN